MVNVCLSHTWAQGDPDKSDTRHKPITPVFISFSHLNHHLKNDSTFFEQEKVVFGARFNMNKHWSGNVWVDFLRDPDEHPYLKPANLTYKKNKFKLDIGLFYLSQWMMQLRKWENRYIQKTFQDYQGFGWSSDVGLRGTYTFNDHLKTDVAVVNGAGYKTPGFRIPFKYSATAYIQLISKSMLKVYYDFYNMEKKQTTLSVFLNYGNGKHYSVSAEYNSKKGLDFKTLSAHGFSCYSNIQLKKELGVFIRYDQIWYQGLKSITLNVQRYDNLLFITGIQYQCLQNIRIAAAYKRWNVITEGTENIFQLSLEYKVL